MLDTLITSDQIKQFYRPSEERWVTLGVDPVRKAENTHRGPERRRLICNDIILADPFVTPYQSLTGCWAVCCRAAVEKRQRLVVRD
jgi:hypothetical protein